MMVLLPVTMDDTHDLLSWRNDPVTRANSRNKDKITQREHDRWMKLNVNGDYPESLIWIADVNGTSVGMVRLNREHEVSITVAPSYRGNGYAKTMLTQACALFGDTSVTAEIRRENLISRYVFEQCGFELIGERTDKDEGYLLYQRPPPR